MEYYQLRDSVKRKALIKRYLSGETNLAEERMLIQWFKRNAAEEDEMQVASLLSILSLPVVGQESVLSDDGVKAFDELVNSADNHKKSIWTVLTAVVSTAAVIAVIFFVPKSPQNETIIPPSSDEIIESISLLYGLSMNDISYIAAEPKGKEVALEVQLTNESAVSFLVSKNAADGSIRLVVNNN